MPTKILSGQVAATNADVLNSTILQSVPANGTVTVQSSSSAADEGTNDMQQGLQIGSYAPMESVLVPLATLGELNARTWLAITVAVRAGTHVLLSFTETGTAVVTYRVIYRY